MRTIVAATDESEPGRQAALAAVRLGEKAAARVVVMTVIAPVPGKVAMAPVFAEEGAAQTAELERLARWLQPDLPASRGTKRLQLAVTCGIPGIEIPRFAESLRADLLAIGRTSRSQARRLLLGDTADAVARRSPIPCLFVPRPLESVTRVLVALDGTERGLSVLTAACDFARAAGARLRVVTVEPRRDNEAEFPPGYLMDGRSAKLAQAIDRLRIDDPAVWAGWEAQGETAAGGLLRIRHGDPVSQVLAEVGASGADVLVIGYHRGGPPGVLEAGSVGRRLAHHARCAVMTVPL